MLTRFATLVVGLALALPPTDARSEAPLSAIDWLSDSIAEENTPVPPVLPATGNEPAVATNALPETITVTPLGQPSADEVGLASAESLGLPRNLWGSSSSAALARGLVADRSRSLPAMRDLVRALATAELDPPADGDPDTPLYFARVDALLAMGALGPAEQLLEQAGLSDPNRFRRWFDVTLLTGTENKACRRLRSSPDLIPTYSARVFCLARGGDWSAAALTLETAEMLEVLSANEGALLAQFLDAELYEGSFPPAPPARPSPLDYRLYEAIGEVIPTGPLPLAFAHTDLRPLAGWNAEVAAAERLVRVGAISTDAWRTIWLRRLPAASGGIWDRIAAFQAFDRAADANDADAAAKALPKAWSAMQSVGLETAFADLYAAKLARLNLPAPADQLAWRIGLLGPDFDGLAGTEVPETADESLLFAFAKGIPKMPEAAEGAGIALLAGFSATGAPDRFAPLLQDNRSGEAVLAAIELFDAGADGDVAKLTDAIALMRHVGLDHVARQAALQILLLAPDA